MANVNLTMLSGKVLGNVKATKDSVSFKMLNIEKREQYEDKAEVTVVTFGELASRCASLVDGSRVYVEGSLHHHAKELPSGKKFYWSEIKAKKVDF